MKLAALRKALHQHPELSDQEQLTAQTIVNFLRPLKPDELYTGVGGTGVIAVFKGNQPGDNVLFRCELDALPIDETSDFDHCSKNPGVAHKCGHDGHMAMVCGLAEILAANRHFTGQRLLLFQPAEETGQGALAVVADPVFKSLNVEYSYALHNLPGVPLGQIQIKAGTFNCASRGMSIQFTGQGVHAAYPEQGRSPAAGLTELLDALLAFEFVSTGDELQMLTVVYAKLGEKSFGTTPEQAEVAVTLRSSSNQGMQQMVEQLTALAAQTANEHHLQHSIDWHDVFLASVNDSNCAKQVAESAKALGMNLVWLDQPLRWSEDFGAISEQSKGAMFVLGAGESTPQLHTAHYDFPDTLLEIGLALFEHIAYAH